MPLFLFQTKKLTNKEKDNFLVDVKDKKVKKQNTHPKKQRE